MLALPFEPIQHLKTYVNQQDKHGFGLLTLFARFWWTHYLYVIWTKFGMFEGNRIFKIAVKT